MKLQVQITDLPIPESLPSDLTGGDGAWVEFRGRVRDSEHGRNIAALEYEAYAAMAEEEIRRILIRISSRHPCSLVRVVHRTGVIPVGEAAIYVGVAAKHRSEAFGALAEFMDRLKQDVPIWKTRSLTDLTQHPEGPEVSPARSATEVIEILTQTCHPLEAEEVPVSHALGRVLRRAITALEPSPAFDRSSVDGYAVRLDDTSEGFRVVDEVRAGEWKPRDLMLGEAVRIATGAAIPCDDLQVIMLEDVQVHDGSVVVQNRSPELNVRFRGEDASSGQEIVPAGTVLQSGALGLLAGCGCTRPLVTRLPGVMHLATGNEIVGPGESPGPGQIRDSNSMLVKAFLTEWGITPDQRRVGEDEESIAAALASQPEGLDLLLISGGASVGHHDFTRRLLEQAGFTIQVSKTTARPGKPLIIGRRGTTLAFGLPGNPLAHFVCLNLYVRCALEGWSGQSRRSQFVAGALAADLDAGGNNRQTFWPGYWEFAPESVQVTPLPWRSSGDITCLAHANALIRIEGNSRRLTRGSNIQFIPTHRRWS